MVRQTVTRPRVLCRAEVMQEVFAQLVLIRIGRLPVVQHGASRLRQGHASDPPPSELSSGASESLSELMSQSVFPDRVMNASGSASASASGSRSGWSQYLSRSVTLVLSARVRHS